MKKILFNATVALALVFGSVNRAEAQAVEQGNIMTTAQYGFPDLYKVVINGIFDKENITGLKVTGVGPISARGEFMIADKIGIGLISNYATTKITFEEGSYYTDTNGVQHQAAYDYSIALNRFRIMPRFSFHFGNSDKFDGYFGVAIGYRSFVAKIVTDDPDVDDDYKFKNLVPIAFRLDLGGNFFITEKFGINFEFGIFGGALLTGGVVTKF